MRLGRDVLIWLALISIFILSLPTSNSAFAVQEEFKWKLEGTLDTSAEVKAGDSVSYTYKLTNTGVSTKTINTPLFIFPPKEFSTTSIPAVANFGCSSLNDGSDIPDSGDELSGRDQIYCAPSGEAPETSISVSPGQSFTFKILGTANSNYTTSSKAYSMAVYSTTEQQQQDWQNGINIWETSPSESVSSSNYIYGEAQAQKDAANASNSKESSQVLGTTQGQNRGVSGGTETGSAANAEAVGDTSPNEIAAADQSKSAETRRPNLKNSNNNDELSWADLFSNNQNVITAISAILILATILTTILFRRIRNKRRLQIEYKKTITKLRNSKTHSPPNSDFAPNPQQASSKSITRTKIVAAPVDLEATRHS